MNQLPSFVTACVSLREKEELAQGWEKEKCCILKSKLCLVRWKMCQGKGRMDQLILYVCRLAKNEESEQVSEYISVMF